MYNKHNLYTEEPFNFTDKIITHLIYHTDFLSQSSNFKTKQASTFQFWPFVLNKAKNNNIYYGTYLQIPKKKTILYFHHSIILECSEVLIRIAV